MNSSPEYSPGALKEIKRYEFRKIKEEVGSILDGMVTEVEHGDELEELENKRKRILGLDFRELITPPKKRRVKEIIREHHEELERLEEERKKREKRRIGKHKQVAYIQNQIQELEKREKIKDPLVKYQLKEMLNMKLANVVGTYNSTVEDTFAIMEAERMLNFRYLEAILRHIFKLKPKKSLKSVTNTIEIKQGLKTLFNCPAMKQAMLDNIKFNNDLNRQKKRWIENWKETKLVILKPPFTALNLDRDTKRFRTEIAKEMDIDENDIFKVMRNDKPLSIGTYTIKNPKESLRVIITHGFQLLKRFYDQKLKQLNPIIEPENAAMYLDIFKETKCIIDRLFVDHNGSNEKIIELTMNFLNADTIAGKKRTYKKVSQVFNEIFIKDFVFRTLRRLYEMEGSIMDKFVDDLNKATKNIEKIKNKAIGIVKQNIIKIITERTIQTKSVFKRLIGKTNFIVDEYDDLEFKSSETFELVPDYKQSDQMIEYWKPLTQLTTGAPVNVIKDEIKIIKDGGIGVYLKLQYVEDPIYGDTTYFLRKFSDFNDFLMAWYDRYHELYIFTGDQFYRQRINDIYCYFKTELEDEYDHETQDKLKEYIQIIEDTASDKNMDC